MIMTNRLAASIDQIEGLVTFDSSRNNLSLWDTQVHSQPPHRVLARY